MSTTNLFPVPSAVAGSAWVDEAGYFRMYQASIDDPEGFWREQAKRLSWVKPPTKIKDVDYTGNVLSSLGMALPSFWLGFMLILVFAVELRWLPASGYRPISFGLWEWLGRLILPVLALSLAQIGLVVRMTRASIRALSTIEKTSSARRLLGNKRKNRVSSVRLSCS